jgi:hypothetical protein
MGPEPRSFLPFVGYLTDISFSLSVIFGAFSIHC